MTIVIVPPYPQRNSPNFAAVADSWNSQLPTWTDQVNATAVDVTSKASTATTQAEIATTQAELATTNGAAQVALATIQANNAANSASAAASTANVTKWISGTAYAEGVNVWSPADFKTYRRKVTGAGTTDPSLDTANWESIYIQTPMVLISTAIANNSVTVDFTGLDATYDKYIVEIIAAIPVYTGANDFLCQSQVSGIWQTSGYLGQESPSWAVSDNAKIYNSLSAKTFFYSTLYISDVANNSRVKPITVSELIKGESPASMIGKRYYYNSVAPLTGLRFIYQTGNIASGTFKLYGLK